MKRSLLALILALAPLTALAQGGPGVILYCYSGSGSLAQAAPCTAANPLATTATITPSGTQNVNITQVLGAAPSATNPIWVSPATASTPWAVTGSGTAGSAAAGVVSVQGIASMTPVQVSQATASNLNATVVGTGTFAVQAAATQSGTWTVQPGNTANTTGWRVENGPYSYGRATADAQIKATAGFIHTVSIAPLTATPTAGLMTVYDSAAESGTVVYAEWIFATDVGHTITLDVPTTTGIYVGFDGTLANVQITVSYR